MWTGPTTRSSPLLTARSLPIEFTSPASDGAEVSALPRSTLLNGVAAVELVKLRALMSRTTGRPEIAVGLIDGPVAIAHRDLSSARIREVPNATSAACTRASSAACQHGTFVAGMLVARRGSLAPAICPGCTLLVRPIFAEAGSSRREPPSATPAALATAIIDCIEGGARVLNLSVGLALPTATDDRDLQHALDHAAGRGVLVVAATGNQGTLGSSSITRHPWVIPVAACDQQGQPLDSSNFGRSIGRSGLIAPGARIRSLGAEGGPLVLDGTSVATPFVTGAIALLWSEFPTRSAADVKSAVTLGAIPRRASVVPPLLDAWAAHQLLERCRE